MKVLPNSGLVATPHHSCDDPGPSTSTERRRSSSSSTGRKHNTSTSTCRRRSTSTSRRRSSSTGLRHNASSTPKRSKQRKRKHSDESDEEPVMLSNAKSKIKSKVSRKHVEGEASVKEDPVFDCDVNGSSEEKHFSEGEEAGTDHSSSSESNFSVEFESSDIFEDDETNFEEDNFDLIYQKQHEYYSKMPRKKRKLNDSYRDVRIHPLPETNSMIVLINHPGSITLYQYVSVKVLSGSAAICGFELTPSKEAINVFSSRSTGLIELTTTSSENLFMNKKAYKVAIEEIRSLVIKEEKVQNILRHINSSTVIIFLKKRHYQANLQFLQLYYPQVFHFKPKQLRSESFVLPVRRLSGHVPKISRSSLCFVDTGEQSMQFNEDYIDLAFEVMNVIRIAFSTDAPCPRILVFGPKNSGKSTLLRFLMNKVLSEFKHAYYLDADPGQPEFTPPGGVSLTDVKYPVIGPAFCHQRKPIFMCFTGGVSADISPDMYNMGVAGLASLMRQYERQFRRSKRHGPLFVNTMGWVKGLGLQFLKNVMKSVKPSIVIEMTRDEDPLVFDYRSYVPDGTKYFQIRSPVNKFSQLNAGELRSMSLLSYFGKMLNPYERIKHLNSIPPFCVCWDDIAVYNIKRRMSSTRLIESINASVVALCKVTESSVLVQNNSTFPATVEDEPDNECIGYGIVRAIDEVHHSLYIVTPVKLNELMRVNAIIKGNVMLPDPLFLKQLIPGTPQCFTHAEIKEDRSTEEASREEMISDIPEKYRKSIKKRYGKTKKYN